MRPSVRTYVCSSSICRLVPFRTGKRRKEAGCLLTTISQQSIESRRAESEHKNYKPGGYYFRKNVDYKESVHCSIKNHEFKFLICVLCSFLFLFPTRKGTPTRRPRLLRNADTENQRTRAQKRKEAKKKMEDQCAFGARERSSGLGS